MTAWLCSSILVYALIGTACIDTKRVVAYTTAWNVVLLVILTLWLFEDREELYMMLVRMTGARMLWPSSSMTVHTLEMPTTTKHLLSLGPGMLVGVWVH